MENSRRSIVFCQLCLKENLFYNDQFRYHRLLNTAMTQNSQRWFSVTYTILSVTYVFYYVFHMFDNFDSLINISKPVVFIFTFSFEINFI